MDGSNVHLTNILLYHILPSLPVRDIGRVARVCRVWASLVRRSLLWELLWKQQYHPYIQQHQHWVPRIAWEEQQQGEGGKDMDWKWFTLRC